jgi:hypothetical protein
MKYFGLGHVERFLESKHHVAPSTRRTYAVTVRSFVSWLHRRGHICKDLARDLKVPRRARYLPRAPAHDDVRAAVAAAPDARAELMMLLMVQLGLRCIEVSRLQLHDVSWTDPVVRVKGKNDSERLLPIDDETLAAMHRYLDEHPAKAGPLIRSYRYPGQPIAAHWVSQSSSRWLRDAGVKRHAGDGVVAHAFQHTFATDILRGGAHVRDVQAAPRRPVDHPGLHATHRQRPPHRHGRSVLHVTSAEAPCLLVDGHDLESNDRQDGQPSAGDSISESALCCACRLARAARLDVERGPVPGDSVAARGHDTVVILELLGQLLERVGPDRATTPLHADGDSPRLHGHSPPSRLWTLPAPRTGAALGPLRRLGLLAFSCIEPGDGLGLDTAGREVREEAHPVHRCATRAQERDLRPHRLLVDGHGGSRFLLGHGDLASRRQDDENSPCLDPEGSGSHEGQRPFLRPPTPGRRVGPRLRGVLRRRRPGRRPT